MRKRITKSALFLGLFLLFGFSNLAGIIFPMLGPGKASAAESQNYVFVSAVDPENSDSLEAFQKAIKDNDHENDIFHSGYVMAKGGVFGDAAVKLSYDQNKTGCAQSSSNLIGQATSLSACSDSDDHFGGQDATLYVYSGEYMCRNGNIIKNQSEKAFYKIRFSVSLNLGGSNGAFDGDTMKNNLRMHWIGFGSNNVAGATFYEDHVGSSIRGTNDVPINRIPKSCLPSDIPSALSGLSDQNSEEKNQGIINKYIAIFETTDEANQKKWQEAAKKGGLEDPKDAAELAASGLENTCDTRFSDPTSWFVCPIANSLTQMAKTLEDAITSQLSVGSPGNTDDPNQIFCSTNTGDSNVKQCQAYHKAWASFRNIALGLLVIVGLIIIISEIGGFEFFDAYTLRRLLPRLVIAAVAVTLSWQLMQFLVAFTNALGFGVGYLIEAPFKDSGLNTEILEGGGRVVALFLAIGAFMFYGPMAMLSFTVTAALAIFMVFLVLILRQMVIIALILVAPIAIVLYILPNTESVYKLWWTTFFRALLMFPMITALIATGRVLAMILSEQSGVLGQILGFAAYFAPYFAIPMTYKFAGGAMSAIGGAVEQRGAGMKQGLAGFRNNQRKQRLQRAGERAVSGNTFKRAPEGSLRHRMNRGISGAANVNKAGFNPRHWRTNVRTAMNDASTDAADKFGQENAAFRAIDGDDALLHASRHYNREQIMQSLENFDGDRFGGEANRARREEATNRIMRAQQETDNATFQKARLIGQSKTGTGYQDENGNFDAAAMMEDINSVYGNDRNGAGTAIAKMRGNLAQSGQIAGAAGFGAWAAATDGLHNGTMRRREAHQTVMHDAIDSATPMQQLHGKPSSARAMAQEHARRIQTIGHQVQRGEATHEDLSAAIAAAATVHYAMSQSSPGNASEFANELMGQSVGTSIVDADGNVVAGGEGASGDDGYGNIVFSGATVKDFIDSPTMGQNEQWRNRIAGGGRRMLTEAELEAGQNGRTVDPMAN